MVSEVCEPTAPGERKRMLYGVLSPFGYCPDCGQVELLREDDVPYPHRLKALA